MGKFIVGTTVDGHTVWHEGNDGDNSGLDADKIKGIQWFVSDTDPASTHTVNDKDVWIDTINLLIKVRLSGAWQPLGATYL